MPTPQDLALMGAPPGENPPMMPQNMPMGPEGPMGGDPMALTGQPQEPIDYGEALNPTKSKGRIFAEALGAGLAGWGGTGQQYLGRMDTLDKKRKVAMIKDGWSSYRNLRKGKYDAAAALWGDRSDILNKGGRDSAETDYISQRMRDDPQGVAEGFRQSLIEASEANGVKIPEWAIPTDIEKHLDQLYSRDDPRWAAARKAAIEAKLKIAPKKGKLPTSAIQVAERLMAETPGLSFTDALALSKRKPSTTDGKSATVKSTEILPDGSIVYAMTDATRVVTNPSGEIVTGAEAAAAVKDAQQYGVKIQTARSSGRTMGASSAKVAEKAIERVGKILQNKLRKKKEIE